MSLFSRRRVVLAAFAVLALVRTPLRAAEPPPGATTYTPDPASVQRYGPAYRYPQSGWIVLHIEGAPYERGYQHGRLLATEIADYVRAVANTRGPSAPSENWRSVRMLVDSLFLRRYEPEYLEEMKGIADGAAAAGAKFDGRPVDLVDIAAINSEMETMCLAGALEATPTGLEGKRFAEPPYARPKAEKSDHCSAFAATGPATADGKVVFGHITMFSLYSVRHYNVWLDIKPERGHRVLMQTYAGGIQSGMDYYMNDAGLLVTETTIGQTRLDVEGAPLASRIRRVLQDASTIDEAVKILDTSNNGLYTNEWLLADTNTNEIAMFELGTHKTKLWRSSKNEWYGGTEGFYWGCNNTKDLDVRLETIPSLNDKPANAVFHPSARDRKWVEVYQKAKGKIDTGFGFEAFTTPPLAAFPSCDAKFTTTAMAKKLETWALFGPPLGRTWDPTDAERSRHPDIRPLVSNDWTVLKADAPPTTSEETASGVDLASPTPSKEEKSKLLATSDTPELNFHRPSPWRGTILPGANADVWLAAAFADYSHVVTLQKALEEHADKGKLSPADQERIDLALFAPRSRYLAAVRRLGRELSLTEVKPDAGHDEWYEVAAGKGVLLLAELRAKMGAERFDTFMDEFGRAHAGKPATTSDFFTAAAKAHGKSLDDFKTTWLGNESPLKPDTGPSWSIDSFEEDPDRSLIVYGTTKELHAQREAAEHLQRRIARRWGNYTVPIKSDVEATDADLAGHHILLIGRPDSNAVAKRFAKQLPIPFGPGSFTVRNETFAHPATAVVVAGANPLDAKFSVVLYAGLSADSTWHVVQRLYDRGSVPAPLVLLPPSGKLRAVLLTSPQQVPQVATERAVTR